MEANGSIQDRIMSRFDGLSPKLRRAAEFVAAHPDEVATRTLRQVAKTANLTPPTLSRLARALEFETYEDLREICRLELKRRNRILADKADALLRLSSEPSSVEKSVVFVSQARSAIENVQELMETADMGKLRTAADTLARARRVVLVGTSSGLAVANYFCCMARLAFDNWQVAGAGGSLWSSTLTDIGPGDVVFLVSIQPYGDLPVRAAQSAREAGADVIAVTDNLASPYGAIASQCFIVGTESPQFFPSHVAAIVLVEGLMGMVVRRGGKQAAERIQQAESKAHELGEYWVN